MDSPLLFFINAVTLSVILFSAHLLFFRGLTRQVYRPLVICMLCIGIIVCQPVLDALAPDWRLVFLVLSLPAILLIPPCFWFYARGLTSETEWQLKNERKWHFVPALIAMGIAVITFILPAEVQRALLLEGDDSFLAQVEPVLRYLVYGLLILTFLLVLCWVLQSGFYFIKIIRQLHQYRLRLKDLFASTESREIHWLTWLLIAVGIVWTVTAINLLLENLIMDIHFPPLWVNLIVLMMVWSLAVWGLRQKPGFEEIYSSEEPDTAQTDEALPQSQAENAKYLRSALNDQQSSRIAEKIKRAMQEDKLYLDASLSLPKLARHTGASANYISQTLNENLRLNFFDFVNRYRVEEAKRLLRESGDNILDIAMAVGFNAKSSFYTAFKKETQLTPNQYRKQQADLSSTKR